MTEAVNNKLQNVKEPGRGLRAGIIYIIVLAMIVAVCGIQAAHQLTNSVSATIRINSVYAADGKNPDGSPFSIMELFSDEVLTSAAQKLDHKLTVEELRSHLDICDTMSVNSFNQLEQSISNGQNENTYFPTEYLLTYSTISRQIKDKGFLAQADSLCQSFSLPTKSEIMSAVLLSYQEYYTDKYLGRDAMFDIEWSAVDSMDYYNRFEFMYDTTQHLKRFIQYRAGMQIKQNSETTGYGYYDLSLELTQGPEKDLEGYEAYVIQNGITNDREKLLRQFAYMQKLSEEENTRKTQAYNVLREAIELYDSTTTKVVFIPALDEENSFYMNRTKVGLDYLTEQADNAKLLADTAAYEAKRFQYLQECFRDGTGSMSQDKNTSSQRAHADGLYQHLKEEIQRLIDETELLTVNENQMDQELLIIGNPFCNVSIVSAAMSSAKKFVFLLMAAYVVGYVVNAVIVRKTRENMGEKQ